MAGLTDDGLLIAGVDGVTRTNGNFAPQLKLILSSSSCSKYVPESIAVGTGGRYFVKFRNGKQMYSKEGSLHTLIGHKEETVRMVAFGAFFKSHAVLFNDGIVSYHNVPRELEKSLQTREKVDFISLGPCGQYFLRFQDGSFKVGGIDDNKLSSLVRIEEAVREIVFGGTNVSVRHDKRRVTEVDSELFDESHKVLEGVGT